MRLCLWLTKTEQRCLFPKILTQFMMTEQLWAAHRSLYSSATCELQHKVSTHKVRVWKRLVTPGFHSTLTIISLRTFFFFNTLSHITCLSDSKVCVKPWEAPHLISPTICNSHQNKIFCFIISIIILGGLNFLLKVIRCESSWEVTKVYFHCEWFSHETCRKSKGNIHPYRVICTPAKIYCIEWVKVS